MNGSQLINVLAGEMSIVGPRPDVAGYYDKLEGENKKSYFEDAEKQQMPEMLIPPDWEQIKSDILKQVNTLL